MRGNAILLIIVTLICVGISVMLIPKKKDIAFLKLKSHDIEGARTALDEQLAQGDASVSVVASRTELALHDGDINTAVSVMENFVTANPEDAGAWRRLATYYRFNQQQLKYVETLAHIVRLDGTDEERHLLANLYRLYGQHDNLLKTLMDINKRGLANPKELAEAAELAAGTGNYRAAHAILHQLLDEHPDAINSHLLTMMVLLGDQLGERDHSVALLKRMAELDNGTKKIEPAINAAYERGNKSLSLALIKPLDGFIERSPVMLSLWSQIKLADGQHAVVLERLMTLEKEGKLPDSSFSLLVQLLLDGRDLETVAELLENRDINILPDWQLTGIIDIAVEEQSRHMLTKVVDEVSAPFRDLHAVSYALALTGLGNLAAADTIAERVDQKLLKPSNIGRKPAERLRLSRLWFALAKPERALTHLKLLARNRTASDDTYRVLTDLLIELQRYQDGLDLFNELRKTRPTPVIEVSWARLSAASGDDANVVKWLAKRSDLGVQSLTGLYFASGPDRAPKTGLLVAERLVNRQPDKLNRSRLATALLANGQYGRATTILKQLLPGDEQIRSAYADALVAQGRSQEAYKMLRQAFDSKLSSPQAANRLVSLAMDLGKTAEALALAQAAGLPRLRPVTIASLIEAVSLTGDTETTDALIASIDPGILKTRPVLSARIAMALGRYDEAGEWVKRADQLSNLTPTERLDLAQIQLTRGEDTDALARLETLARSPDTPASAITDLAALYVKTDRVASGLPVLRSIAAKRSESSIGEARMVMEATSGDLETVNTWLQGPDVPTRQALLDIYYAAENRADPTLANLAAEKLFTLYPGDDATVIRARTLVQADKPRDALKLLENLLPGNAEVRSVYITALARGGQTEDLKAYAQSALSDPNLPPAQRDTILYALVNANEPAQALPSLKKLATEDPAKWQETYINALASTGSPDQLKAYGTEALKNPDIPPRARETLVYALLNIQAHDTVVPTLRSLAKSDPDKWQGTYIAALAGEKYTGERTRLLIRRLKQVRPGPDRDQLLYDLLATAGPETALPYLRKRAARKNAGPWTATYVQALRDLGRKKELIGYYRKRSLAKGLPAKERREAAFVLLEMNARRDAENAFLQLAATAEPTSPDVQQLLYLWGPRPPKSAREWLHKRATTAPRRERVKWLRLLNQTGEFRTLAATPDNKLPKSMTDRSTPAYVEAMQQARDLPKLRRFLNRIARTAETRKEQLRLAEWAEQANHPALASSLFQKLANRKNASAETLFRAGQAQFFASKYRAAIPILDRYLKQVNGKPDPRAPFYRAQSHAALRRPDRASADFARTLQLLGPKEPANLELRRIRVQSLVGTRQFEKAVTAFERLLKDAPDNQDIRADFAALLIEIGELDKAELLLAAK